MNPTHWHRRHADLASLLRYLGIAQRATLLLLALALLLALLRQPEGFLMPIVLLAAVVAGVAGLRLLHNAQTELAAEIRVRKEAEQEARAASQAQTRFLANMSHEIRTPMNAVLGTAELLADMELAPAALEHLEVVRTSGEALLALIDDILDFSKIEADKVNLDIASFDLRDLIKKVTLLLRARAEEKGLTFALELAPETPTHVRGDAARLRQVLINLGGNAVKFTAEGRVELTVEPVAEGVGGASRVVFRVRDTGIGIAAEQQEQIFETFVQADSSSARRSGGSGLGLAICKKLVELMAGEIGVESVRGVGSCFWFEVPLPIAEPAPAGDAEPALDEERRRGRLACRVLVVDDHAANRNVAVSRLDAMGYPAEAAAGGVEALSRLASERFDVVLMDCQMPELDGYETTRRLRGQEPAGVHVPVIAVTAHAFAEERQRCLDAGMDDYLAKPFRSADLAAVLDRWLLDVPDPEAIAALRRRGKKTGRDLLGETIEDFRRGGEENVATLRQAVAAGDFVAVAEAAHRLRGSALMLGARRLAELAGEFEVHADSATKDSATKDSMTLTDGARRVDEIAKAFGIFISRLETLQ